MWMNIPAKASPSIQPSHQWASHPKRHRQSEHHQRHRPNGESNGTERQDKHWIALRHLFHPKRWNDYQSGCRIRKQVFLKFNPQGGNTNASPPCGFFFKWCRVIEAASKWNKTIDNQNIKCIFIPFGRKVLPHLAKNKEIYWIINCSALTFGT